MDIMVGGLIGLSLYVRKSREPVFAVRIPCLGTTSPMFLHVSEVHCFVHLASFVHSFIQQVFIQHHMEMVD